MSEQADHYFTAEPASDAERRSLDVELAGRRVRVQTAPGVFCPDRVDAGTAVLLKEAPQPPAEGDLLDLGCGWGPIALTLGLRSPAARVWAVDVNRRALELARHNAASLGVEGFHACGPQEVPAQVRFATIWSNPPIRVGKAVLHDMLLTWLPRLEAGGTAYLVVQKNLGADSLQRWLADRLDPGRLDPSGLDPSGLRPSGLALGALDPGRFVVGRHATARGFRVLSLHRAT